MRRLLMLELIAVVAFLALARVGPAAAQTPVGSNVNVTGVFVVVWGPPDHYFVFDPADPSRYTRVLLDDNVIRQAGGIRQLQGQRVRVDGNVAAMPGPGAAQTVRASALAADAPTGPALAAVSGSTAWLNLMCRFSDITTEPRADYKTWIDGVMGTTYPGMDHYYREVSENQINLTGTTTHPTWFVLPQPKSYYVPASGPDLGKLFLDCTAVADAAVDFSQYYGVNLFFNSGIGGSAFGGGWFTTLDGQTKVFRSTWLPGPTSHTTVAHEIGHGYTLPHSGDRVAGEYNDRWDVMGLAPTMPNNPYGGVTTHTIAYHKDILGWIPPARKYTHVSGSQTVTLERLALPQSGNYRIAKIPIRGWTSKYYTVEARVRTGYDMALAGDAVIIHEIDEGRKVPAYVIDHDLNGNTADAGAQWTPGETFTDALNGISVTVVSATANGFTVTISTTADSDTLEFTTQPDGAEPGAPLTTQPVVRLKSMAGATVTGFNGPVTLHITEGTGAPGAILEGATTVNAVNGVATFSGLSVDLAGSAYKLTATSGDVTPADSAPFTIIGGVLITDAWANPQSDDFTARKQVFRNGEPIRYVGAFANRSGAMVSPSFTFTAQRTGQTLLNQTFNFNLNPGEPLNLGLDHAIPANACATGQLCQYTLTISVTHNGVTTTQTSVFDVTDQNLACSGVEADPSRTSPRPPGIAVVIRAGATGCYGAAQYEFALKQGNGSFNVTQAFSTTNTWNWSTGASGAGEYTIRVRVRAPGVVSGFQAEALVPYSLTNPRPRIDGLLSPYSAEAGVGSFSLTIQGVGFTTSSVLHWNASARPSVVDTTAQRITAQISAADVATGGDYALTVINPAPGGGSSNVWNFRVIGTATPSLFGTVTLQGRNATSPFVLGYGVGHSLATVTLTPGNITAPVNPDGSFVFTDLPSGTYNVIASAPGYLSAQKLAVPITAPVTLTPVQLLAGAVTPDAVINLHDITVSLAAFGTMPAGRVDAQQRPVDVNGDGVVNIVDITLIIGNFGRRAPTDWP